MIQARIGKSKKIFAKLVMEGQINSAMRFLSEEGNGGDVACYPYLMTPCFNYDKSTQKQKKRKLALFFVGHECKK